MFRIEDGKDITDDEFDEIVAPFIDSCNDYIEKKIIPEYVVFYISNGYKASAIWSASYDVLINTAMDTFNVVPNDMATIKREITDLLEQKYMLRIIKEDPLEFEEVVKND